MRVPRQRQDPPRTRQRGLRPHLGGELSRPHPAAEESAGELGEAQETTLRVHEAPDRRRVADRPALHEVDVQADLEVRLHARQRRRLRRRVGGHDQ